MSRVPQHASGGASPTGDEDIDQLEELGDDAIIAQQRGAHAPAQRAQVTEEARSIVISDEPQPAAPTGKSGEKRRSERTEKTVVIRDRRQVDELRRQLARRRPPTAALPQGKGLLLWVIVGIAAFLMGGLVALFATSGDDAALSVQPAASQQVAPAPAVSSTAEPPAVSIDELPIEGSKKH